MRHIVLIAALLPINCTSERPPVPLTATQEIAALEADKEEILRENAAIKAEQVKIEAALERARKLGGEGPGGFDRIERLGAMLEECEERKDFHYKRLSELDLRIRKWSLEEAKEIRLERAKRKPRR